MTIGSISPQGPDEHEPAWPIDEGATYHEVYSLALYLCEHEGLTLASAMRQAADELEVLLTFAQGWDAVVELIQEAV